MSKAQADIVSAVIIVVIALGLTSAGYLWGMPLIKKKQDAAIIERAFSYFNPNNVNSLPKTIEYIANVGGEKDFQIDLDGIWRLNETETIDGTSFSSLQFTFVSKASNVAPNTSYPISLTSGVQCINGTSPKNGTMGLDSPSVVCTQAFLKGDVIEINYKIWFRDLYENPFSSSSTGVKIILVQDPSGLSTSTGKTVKVSFMESKTEGNLITKKIKILLI
jgi:hypothetical protein